VAKRLIAAQDPGRGQKAGERSSVCSILFSAAFGILLGLAFLKFGNPINLDHLIDPPDGLWEYVFQPWPVRWGYMGLLGCAVLSFWVLDFRIKAPKWVIALPVVWFGWQLVSNDSSVSRGLSQATLGHFTACLVCFFLGLFALARSRHPAAFWFPLLIAFLAVLWMGFEQHYGGLEATRKMFFEQPNWRSASPDYIKKLESNRIFSTLVYPNALAAAILTLAAPMLLMAWRLSVRLTDITRAVIVGIIAYAAAACLFWSGSKSGWLIALVLLVAVLVQMTPTARLRAAIITGVLIVGLAGFFVKFAGYFHRGAPSVSARFDYWRAALQTAKDHPWFGTGPGTFSVAYRKIKKPESEMAQLAHNDYLEQASDSGWIGFLSYVGFVTLSVVLLGRDSGRSGREELFAVWLGLLAWSLQSFVEFLLYIPALSWTAFAFLGWLWGTVGSNNEIDRVTKADHTAVGA
jgi:O-antigen ligase